MSTASSTGGKIPYSNPNVQNICAKLRLQIGHTEMIPTTGFGSLHIHARKAADLQTVNIFEMTPTNATIKEVCQGS